MVTESGVTLEVVVGRSLAALGAGLTWVARVILLSLLRLLWPCLVFTLGGIGLVVEGEATDGPVVAPGGGMGDEGVGVGVE